MKFVIEKQTDMAQFKLIHAVNIKPKFRSFFCY